MTADISPTAAQFLESVRKDSDALAAAARKGLDTAVPSCPGWTVRDLVIHTGRVHHGKEMVVRQGLRDSDVKFEEPTGDVVEWFVDGATRLVDTLASKDPGDPAWSWHPPDQTVGFWQRRMAQETVIHRVDAELANGPVTAIDPLIAADGVDEALNVYIAGYPSWATLEPGEKIVRLRTGDRTWHLRDGTFSGTTRSGRVLSNIPTLTLEDGVTGWDCEVSGSPAALDLWLWGRGPLSDLEVSGDAELAKYVRKVAADST